MKGRSGCLTTLAVCMLFYGSGFLYAKSFNGSGISVNPAVVSNGGQGAGSVDNELRDNIGETGVSQFTSASYSVRSGMLAAAAYPNTITNLSGLPGVEEGEIYLSWTAPGANGTLGNCFLYDIRYSTRAAKSPAISEEAFQAASSVEAFSAIPAPVFEGSIQSFTITGLIPGSSYYFAIKACNDDFSWGFLSNGATVYAKSTDNITPGAVTSLAAYTGRSAGEIDLSWISPGDDNFSGDIIDGKYKIRLSTFVGAEGFWDTPSSEWEDYGNRYEFVWSTDTVPYSRHSRTLTGLTEGKLYYIHLWTRDEKEVNWSPMSNEAAARPPDIWKPAPVTNLAAAPTVNEGQVRLEWTAPTENEGLAGTSSVAGYRIKYSLQPPGSGIGMQESWWNSINTQVIISGSELPGRKQYQVLNMPLPGLTYYFSIRSFDDAYPVPYVSDLDSGTFNVIGQAQSSTIDIPPSAPHGLTVLSMTTNYLRLSWAELTQAERTVDFSWYNIYKGTDMPTSRLIGQTTSSAFAEQVGPSDVAQYYYVTGVDRWPNGLESGISNIVRIDPVLEPLPVPEGLTITSSDRKVRMTWLTSDDPAVKGYQVFRSTDEGQYGTEPYLPLTEDGYIEDLAVNNGTTYYYRIRTVGVDDRISDWSAEVSTTPKDEMPPSAVYGMRIISEQSYTGMRLTWSPVETDEDGQPCSDLKGYRIYRGVTLTGEYLPAGFVPAGAATGWVDTTAVSGSGYFYTVRAVDTSDNTGKGCMLVDSTYDHHVYFFSSAGNAWIVLSGAVRDTMYADGNAYGEDLMVSVSGADAPGYSAAADFWVKRARTGQKIDGYIFGGEVQITVSYVGRLISAGAPARTPATGRMFMFWHNGHRWIKMGGTDDARLGAVSFGTKRTGRFGVKSAVPGNDFEITAILPDKIFTPNGDGWNDFFEIRYLNPKDDFSIARVFDISGREIATMRKADTDRAFIWDGRDSSGASVAGGIYIYQVEISGSETRTVNGTCVVAR